MTVNIKRSVHIFVKVDDSFRKKYIIFINKLIEDLKHRLLTYSMSLRSKSIDQDYRQFLTQKKNETQLQIDQLRQQVLKVKKVKDGDRFKLSTVEGFSPINQDHGIFSAISPVIVDVEDQKITRIVQ